MVALAACVHPTPPLTLPIFFLGKGRRTQAIAVAGIVIAIKSQTKHAVTIFKNITSSLAINGHHTNVMRVLPHVSNALTYGYNMKMFFFSTSLQVKFFCGCFG